MTDIVQAEVVEVPKPDRPELWIAIRPKVGDNGWLSSHPYEDQKYASEYFGSDTLIIKVPGTQPTPNNAPATDAVEALVLMGYEVEVYMASDDPKYFWCRVRTRQGRDVQTECADSIQAAAARCLAKIRGGK